MTIHILAHRRLDWLLPSWLENANAFDQSIDEDLSTVAYTVAVSLFIFVSFNLSFSIIRMHYLRVYAPKIDIMPKNTPPLLSNDTFFGWIHELLLIPDEVIIDKAGYDVMFLIRFYRLAFKIFFCFSSYAWIVLLPINWYTLSFISPYIE